MSIAETLARVHFCEGSKDPAIVVEGDTDQGLAAHEIASYLRLHKLTRADIAQTIRWPADRSAIRHRRNVAAIIDRATRKQEAR